jgi:type 2 lantibiotic biosynthesis protein LanM
MATINLKSTDISQIAHQSMSLWENIYQTQENGLFLNSETNQQRLEHWCQVVAKGDHAVFERRLAWDGWSISPQLHSLDNTINTSLSDLPSWTDNFTQLIKAIEEYLNNSPKLIPQPSDNPIPFEDLLLSLVYGARLQLCRTLKLEPLLLNNLPLGLLSEQAYLSLETSLLTRLTRICTPTLESEFAHFRPLGQNLLNLLVGETGDSNKQLYNAFVQNLLATRLLPLFEKYPVLARLITTAVNFWVDSTVEFLNRLETDSPEIHVQFQPLSSIPLGKITQLSAGLSDAHHQGRCVIGLTFDSGLKLAYKPKSLGLDVAFNQLLEWCNQQNLPLDLRTLQILNRDNYGWTKWVEHEPCLNTDAAQNFYRRAGMLLALLYILRCTDCHYENLIACGEYPILIDYETLMSPDIEPIDITQKAIPHTSFWNSVLRTGMLPRWEIQAENSTPFDVSGLGGTEAQKTPNQVPKWKAINTDNMHLSYESILLPRQANVPLLDHDVLSPNNYGDEIVDGFQAMYHLFWRQRPFLLSETSPLTAFQDQQIRFIFRATALYSRILSRSLSPIYLRNGCDRSIELDYLSRSFLTAIDKPKAWSILRAEIQMLEALDIPHFEVNANDTTLRVKEKPIIENFFTKSSYHQVIDQLNQLSHENLSLQLRIIRTSFQARAARAITPLNNSKQTIHQPIHSAILNPDQLRQEAIAIANELASTALHNPDGSVSWMGLNYIAQVERYQLQPLSDGLYNGLCGIALFLSACDHIHRSNQFRHLVLGALQPLRHLLQTTQPANLETYGQQIGIGSAEGIGGLIYALTYISKWYNEPSLLDDAEKLAQIITPEMIQHDQQLDVISGSAGAILGLLKLYEYHPKANILSKANHCGRWLCQQQIKDGEYPKAWKTLETAIPLTGFSHGAAGIAYALLRLYDMLQEPNFQLVASNGIEYEKTAFLADVGNWLDFRQEKEDKKSHYMMSWCHGAPGIGLARLGSLSGLNQSQIRQDLETALITTQKSGENAVDHICCGNFGRVDILLQASKVLNRPELLQVAIQQSSKLVAKAELQGNYRTLLDIPNAQNPGLFDGVAGIGYTLLRMSSSNQLPCILLWE